MAEHVITRTDPAGNIKPDKSKSEKKIDGIAALVMSLGIAMELEEEDDIDFGVTIIGA